MRISNDAGEVVAEVKSDAEAADWWLANGRSGDHVVETGESLSDIASNVRPDAVWRVNADGCVVPTDSDTVEWD